MIESAGLEALQRLQQVSDAWQTSSAQGSLDSVPQALADEFKALMQQDVVGLNYVNQVDGAGLEVLGANASTDSSLVSDPSQDLAVDRPSADGLSLQTPAELLGLQCSVNMQLFETKMMSAVRDHAAQDFEQILKSNS
jgi:hypothetical protein